MAEIDWFNKPVENSRELILKEAFKLFLQKNVEKVTVPELERVTKLQRGAIFYHFKDKSAIFEEVIERYFFSSLNILYPISPDRIYSSSNPQPIGFRGNLLVKRQKFFYCTYSLGITETS